jgi:uncharacterized protein
MHGARSQSLETPPKRHDPSLSIPHVGAFLPAMFDAIRIRASGRGLGYSAARGLVESALRVAYRGGWPARLWGRLPVSSAVRVVHRRIPLPAPRALPLRVAFVSDLHLGPTTSWRTLDEAFRLLREASPDVLVLGGDYVFLDATPALARELEARVRDVPARLKVAVLGNHDLWAEHDMLEDALRRAGASVLVNDAVRLDDDIAIVGLDDPWTGRPDGARAFARAGGAPLVIAVCHAPGGFHHVRGRGAALFLCGHTHGGQVALPGGRPIVVPGGRFARRFPHGVHDIDGTTMFVSRGIGGVEIPFRTFAPPDVGLFDIG